MELFLGVIFYMLFLAELSSLKSKVFLELKNYSYTFEGEKFRIDIIPAERGARLYELLEDGEGLYILVPVPFSEKELLRITYPRESFLSDRRRVIGRFFLFFGIASVVAFGLSVAFSIYAVNPMRQALRMIEEVNKDIIHDLNTPMMTLRVNLKMLRSKYPQDEELERIEFALKQLETFKENLRPLETKTEFKMEEVNLKELIEKEAADFKKVYPEKEIRLELETVKIKADRSAAVRIVSNLLENAFKHGLKGSWVRVLLRGDKLIVENPSKPPRDVNKLFERYYRESQRGLGLGLSIVKKLASELGWKVKAEYSDGVFRVVILLKKS